MLRPGGLTDEPGTGRVTLDRHVERGSVPRDDVAAVLAALLDAHRDGAVLELVSGPTPIADAVADVMERPRPGHHASLRAVGRAGSVVSRPGGLA